ncbi:unnamed protein product [Owenia fusiformis]|uniref:Uncharacterized protein n=1 Tax=Owenia fusiformis TaxID=6347 RepID=A0A8J1TDT3_OWEFU|nr:unnamed protein product [Owenia fusiformis]
MRVCSYGNTLSTSLLNLCLSITIATFYVTTTTSQDYDYSSLEKQLCDRVFTSANGKLNGTFQSPNYPSNYDSNKRCIYKFIGNTNERVTIKFTDFRVKGIPPGCRHDYIDIFTELTHPDEDLLDAKLQGRYCGDEKDKLPHLLVSMSNILVISFFTDNTRTEKGFYGKYTFISNAAYIVGTLAPASTCGYIIKSEARTTGSIISPTYPGVYPDNTMCFYKLQGAVGERVKVTFIDFDLYQGGEHCPFDSVKIYDGHTNQDTLIGVFCGKHKNLTVFSTGQALHIDFRTKSGRLEPTKKTYFSHWEIDPDYAIKRTGFKAIYEFSMDFVNLDFIDRYKGKHIRGTECDQRVKSDGESNGTIVSPNYPQKYPKGVTCRYYIDGKKDKQHLEKAEIKFSTFGIPTRSPEGCESGYLLAYLGGQQEEPKNYNKKLCGKTIPPPLMSTDPRLLLIFNSTGPMRGSGFKATYQFLTNYAIPGTPVPSSVHGCHFRYLSRSSKSGYFNSPRHPANYPSNTTCIYEFIGQPSEQVRITFMVFSVDNSNLNYTNDLIEIYEVYILTGGRERAVLSYVHSGTKPPGPLLSEPTAKLLRIIFKTDKSGVKVGFNAQYKFMDHLSQHNTCGGNITSGGSGVITSPNYPKKYIVDTVCEWHIHAKPNHKILLVAEKFNMEGQTKAGCQGAVLRIYDVRFIPKHELCGSEFPTNVRSEGPYLKLRFISSSRAVGGNGFNITWTEYLDMPRSVGKTSSSSSSSIGKDPCPGFRCAVNTNVCIPNSLKCNRLHNCGHGDYSDELESCPVKRRTNTVHVIIGIIVAIVILTIIIICVVHKRRRTKKKKHKKQMMDSAQVRFLSRPGTSSDDLHILTHNDRTHHKVSMV